jgi:dCTP deaminase
MARRAQSGELFWGYSVGENGRIIVTLLDAPRHVGRDSLLEIELDNGEVIRATSDHDFMLRDGRMLEAAALRPGQSLMPLYRDLFRGYEMVYQPINGHLLPTHRLADEWNLRAGIYADTAGTHRHHIDLNRRNNRPVNLERRPAPDHIRLHNGDARAHGAAIRDAPLRLAPDPSWRERFGAAQPQRSRMFWSDDCDRSVFRRFPHVIAQFTGRSSIRNHKVVAIRDLPGDHDVYCVTVPEAGNFALRAGVFVRNCGIIVNVTPLEPEWEGHVTLEFSNTTPLPAKIYANEGVAQVIFFESDEVCEISYKDRGGKYQGQKGVTLPKI